MESFPEDKVERCVQIINQFLQLHPQNIVVPILANHLLEVVTMYKENLSIVEINRLLIQTSNAAIQLIDDIKFKDAKLFQSALSHFASRPLQIALDVASNGEIDFSKIDFEEAVARLERLKIYGPELFKEFEALRKK
jgi:hypothetical protein